MTDKTNVFVEQQNIQRQRAKQEMRCHDQKGPDIPPDALLMVENMDEGIKC